MNATDQYGRNIGYRQLCNFLFAMSLAPTLMLPAKDFPQRLALTLVCVIHAVVKEDITATSHDVFFHTVDVNRILMKQYIGCNGLFGCRAKQAVVIVKIQVWKEKVQGCNMDLQT